MSYGFGIKRVNSELECFFEMQKKETRCSQKQTEVEGNSITSNGE